jgi:PPOX class probable F420-dependent enzyme
LPESVRRLVDGPDVAVLSTSNPDGTHHVCVMWVGRDQDELLMVTKKHRQQYLNLVADPRATVLVYARARPTHYVEVRGHASFDDEGADALMDTLAHVYTGTDYVSPDPTDARPRVIVRITADRVLEHGSPA